MKTWKKALIAVSLILIVLVVTTVILESSYTVHFYKNKRKLTFDCDAEITQGQVKVMSANIRCDSPSDTGKRAWLYRADLIAKNIKQVKPTIICMQEVKPWQYRYYKDILTQFDSEIVYRDNTSRTEGCPVFYRKDLYTLVDKGCFWLSETPEVMSKDWGAAYYRICSYAVLKDNATGRRFAVFNTHLDHVSEEARIKGIRVIIDKMKKIGEIPVVIMGDFNADEQSKTYKEITQELDDVKYKVENDFIGHCTFQNWGENLDSLPIDFLMVSKTGFTADSYEVITTTYDGAYPSDHFPIVTKLTFA